MSCERRTKSQSIRLSWMRTVRSQSCRQEHLRNNLKYRSFPQSLKKFVLRSRALSDRKFGLTISGYLTINFPTVSIVTKRTTGCFTLYILESPKWEHFTSVPNADLSIGLCISPIGQLSANNPAEPWRTLKTSQPLLDLFDSVFQERARYGKKTTELIIWTKRARHLNSLHRDPDH